MSKRIIFRGVATALITPFTENGVDFPKLGRLIDWQIDEGIDGLVVCGTSGESSTMTDDEHRDTIAYSVKRAAGRVPVIAGTGSNDTAYAVALTKFAADAGADAALVVTPYYNKTTQKGLIRHFNAITEAADIPLIVYNIPSRSGMNIEPETYAELAKNPKIVGIKEANGNIVKIADTMALVGDGLTLYSGDDDQMVPLMSLGGQGCISVLSNLLPRQAHDICARFFAGDVKGAAELQLHFIPLIRALFSEVNPIPAKTAMAALGFCEDIVRMPLCEMDEVKKERLFELMRAEGLKV